MKKIFIYFVFAVLLSCKKDNVDDGGGNNQTTLSDKIAKTWVANSVKEDGASVYSKGDNSNLKPGYSAFKLDLQKNGTLSLEEIEGTKISGKWRLASNDSKLVLENLQPVPSESGGTLEFTISLANETNLNISATKSNFKTGGTMNTYILIPG
ncbi:hypothetical protein [uncultured Arcticibacterium sp.]|uniref:hypothetical protein n=1 Tax=uncultured Arcticibacterium sp. TaxID=2173042 RepID=UPI0030FBF7D2